jgi:hypothetical protein
MTAEQRFRNLLNFKKLDKPMVFGEIRQVEFINAMTGGDLRKADEEEAIWLTATAYVRAGVSLCRTLMLPKWGLHENNGENILWDGYLNWKPGGDRQLSYDKALEKLRIIAKSINDDQIIQAANETMNFRNKVQNIMGDQMHFMPYVNYGSLESIYHLVGLENFACIMVDDPGLIDDVMEAVFAACRLYTETTLKHYKGPAVHFGDDLGMKNTTIFSPTWLREHYFPKLKGLADCTKNLGAIFTFHSCGNVKALLDDFDLCGIKMLENLEWTSGMRLKETKEKVVLVMFYAAMRISIFTGLVHRIRYRWKQNGSWTKVAMGICCPVTFHKTRRLRI